MVIVIDGPAGSGKSSTARAVAQKMDIRYLDSGALYRAATLLYLESQGDRETFFRKLDRQPLDFTYGDGFRVLAGGRDRTAEIRTPEVTRSVSEVAAMPRVREHVNKLMRRRVAEDVYIAEGRDLGTAVFPDAALKIFMSADVEERARRRYREMKQKHPETDYQDILENIRERDHRDAARVSDPLRKADDAVEIDTTDSTFEQQVDRICSLINQLNKPQP
ncbi:MAG: (d)CMP kinase [Balneolaceae bacterium]|nr:(d)CMP kinase [Balneolaceae bacterium]